MECFFSVELDCLLVWFIYMSLCSIAGPHENGFEMKCVMYELTLQKSSQHCTAYPRSNYQDSLQ